MSVTKAHGTSDWMVRYKSLVKGSFEVEDETVRAKHVIISAGHLALPNYYCARKSLGSTSLNRQERGSLQMETYSVSVTMEIKQQTRWDLRLNI